MQNFPAFQGLRSSDASTKADAIAPQAAALECVAAPEVEQRLPAQNIHEPVDNEELLAELDACGVSVLPIPPTHRSLSTTRECGSHLCTLSLLFAQVGFIASLKNDLRHEIVSQVSRPPHHRGALTLASPAGLGGPPPVSLPTSH